MKKIFLVLSVTAILFSGCKKESTTASGTCSDGIKNQNETAVDCGGVCSVCNTTSGTCSDGIQNQNETGIDCGGTCSACSSGTKTLSVNTQTLSFSSSSGSNDIIVESNISWSVSSPQSWISVSPSYGSNNGSFSVHVSSNSSTSSRSGTVTVSGSGLSKGISVSQAAGAATQYGTISFYRGSYQGPIVFYFEGNYISDNYTTYYSSNPGCFPSGAIYNTNSLPYGSYSYRGDVLNGSGQVVYSDGGSVNLNASCVTQAVSP